MAPSNRMLSLLRRRFKTMIEYNNSLMELRAAQELHEDEDVVLDLEKQVEKARRVASEFATTRDQQFIDTGEYVPL